MRGVAKMLEYKQKRNNGRTPFAGVYKFVCVGVWVCACAGDHARSHSDTTPFPKVTHVTIMQIRRTKFSRELQGSQ